MASGFELHCRNGQIFWGNQQVSIRGINWFGLETADFALHGLWCKNMQELLDFTSQHFNAIRMPFSAELALNMEQRQPGNIDYAANPDLAGLNTGQVMDRFVQECAKRGLLVMLDMHRLAAAKDIPELWYDAEYPEAAVLKAWNTIVLRYKDCWNVFAADLNNEPHGRATWGDGNVATDWRLGAERIAAVVQEANPRLLIFVEGVESAYGEHSWWGGCFTAAGQAPVRLTVPDKLVYSPHVYGPSVHAQAYFSDPNFPNNLPPIWIKHFACVLKDNLGPAIVPGEWGGWAREGSSDLVWQKHIAQWFHDNGVTSSFYWCLNPNSGDTGGVLCDSWCTPQQHKLDIIATAHPNPTTWPREEVHPQVPSSADCEVQATVDPASAAPAAPAAATPAARMAAAPTPAAAGGPLSGTVDVKETSSWSEGSTPVTQYDIKVTNTGSGPANSMKLLVTPPAGAELGNSWNSTRLPDEGGAWAFGLPDWCTPAGMAAGSDLVVGVIVKGAKLDAGAVVLQCRQQLPSSTCSGRAQSGALLTGWISKCKREVCAAWVWVVNNQQTLIMSSAMRQLNNVAECCTRSTCLI